MQRFRYFKNLNKEEWMFIIINIVISVKKDKIHTTILRDVSCFPPLLFFLL